jgi:hypothetical protein
VLHDLVTELSPLLPTLDMTKFQRMADAFLLLIARFGGDTAPLKDLLAMECLNGSIIKLSAHGYRRFMGSKCLHVFETEVGAALRSVEGIADIVERMTEDAAFLNKVRRNYYKGFK